MEDKNDYPCSQPDLYAAGIYAWTACLKEIDAFAGFNSKYTPAYIQSNLDAIEAARLLKGKVNLDVDGNKVRIRFDQSRQKCCDNTQLLKQYILTAFDKDMQGVNLQEAGLGFYEKAAAGNWAALSDMMTLGSTYIIANLAPLTDAKMPPAFATTFTAAVNACFALNKEVGQLTSGKSTGTSIKVQANNAVYAAVSEMFGNGQRIFTGARKRDFVFSNVLRIVRGNRIAGLKGTITSGVNKKPVVGAVVSVANTDYTATTDKKGRYHIKQILAGPYTFQVQAPGFTPAEKTITIRPGVTSRASFPLAPAQDAQHVA